MSLIQLREVSATDHATVEEIGRLRIRAWATEIPEAAGLGTWLDQFDPIARHWIITRDDKIVAAARMTVHQDLEQVPEPEVYVGVFSRLLPSPIASINRLVVDPSARGLGLSKRLDERRLEAAELAGCKCVVGLIHSDSCRINQLEKLGFVVVGAGAGPGCGDGFTGPLCFNVRPIVVVVCNLPRMSAYCYNLDYSP